MTTEQIYRRQEFVHRVHYGIGAFVRNTPKTSTGNRHIDSSHVEHWHETDWPELPADIRREITGWVTEYRSAVESFEATSIHIPHTSHYALQLLEDISRQLVERHVVT
jgi:hypothetical protein